MLLFVREWDLLGMRQLKFNHYQGTGFMWVTRDDGAVSHHRATCFAHVFPGTHSVPTWDQFSFTRASPQIQFYFVPWDNTHSLILSKAQDFATKQWSILSFKKEIRPLLEIIYMLLQQWLWALRAFCRLSARCFSSTACSFTVFLLSTTKHTCYIQLFASYWT